MNKEDYFKYYIQGSDHYLIPKDIFDELFNEMSNWKEESKELKQKYLNAVADYEITMSELQELKKENKILRENAEHNDKVVDKVNWENMLLKKENQELKRKLNEAIHKATEFESEVYELKKQLEEYKNPLKGIFAQVNDDMLLRNCGAMQSVIDTYKNQQKEFIEYLEDEIKRINPKELDIGELNLRLDDIKFTQYLIYKEILQKYKSIIGGKE